MKDHQSRPSVIGRNRDVAPVGLCERSFPPDCLRLHDLPHDRTAKAARLEAGGLNLKTDEPATRTHVPRVRERSELTGGKDRGKIGAATPTLFPGPPCHQVVPERIKQPCQAAVFVYGLCGFSSLRHQAGPLPFPTRVNDEAGPRLRACGAEYRSHRNRWQAPIFRGIAYKPSNL